MIFKSEEGSSRQLIQFCIGYFVLYIITGVSVKYFLGSPEQGFPGMLEINYLVYNTIGGNLLALVVVLLFRWYRMASNSYANFMGMKIPSELLYIIPSGVCTAVVIPTTTLMYTLPISVMVAMVIMRGSIIVISRIIDAIQIKQGILTKRVYWEENVAVLFAVIAVSANLVNLKPGSFDFVGSTAAMSILTAYLIAYSIRIYIMNYYKNTRGKGVKQDNKAFFAIEQIAATLSMLIGGIILFNATDLFGWDLTQIVQFREAFTAPDSLWGWAMISGLAFGLLAFFSVFIFMFKGRTATFAGLVNRLTSLIAGTAATLLFAIVFGGKYPVTEDWITLGFILIAVAFLTKAEKKRAAELKLNTK
ncbi:MAG TPA: hypothetical protein PK605_11395 [Ignavibacteria bacterium]|nr:hypothetical protein [Ignavibacteria bacterium]HRJ04997.1 hypothetical protein [Ignavibacteria bacterium]